MKAEIRKRDGRWALIRPAFGFRQHDDIHYYPSHDAAVKGLIGGEHGVVSAGGQVAFGGEPWRGYGRGRYNNVPVRIDAHE